VSATSPIADLAPLPVVLPMVGSAVLAGARKWLSRAAADSIGIAFAAATLAISALLLVHSMHGTEVYWFGNWHPRGSIVLGIAFVIEPIGAGLATLAALLTLLALLFSWRFVDSGGNHFQSLMLVFHCGVRIVRIEDGGARPATRIVQLRRHKFRGGVPGSERDWTFVCGQRCAQHGTDRARAWGTP
jgi:hypothetical protein